MITEIIDGEAVMIHLATGNYYTLDASGSEVWALIERQASVDEIVDAVTHGHDASREDVETAVRQLLDELQHEGLVVPADGPAPASAPVANGGPPSTRLAFNAPSLSKYTDMQDLILLDPVHEVDERGWPHAKVS